MQKSIFEITKMDCPSEENLIRMKLDGIDGVQEKSKSKEEAHMKTSMIFTSNDIIINLGVITAGLVVLWTQTAYPD
jgi:copper chaperone CopZ